MIMTIISQWLNDAIWTKNLEIEITTFDHTTHVTKLVLTYYILTRTKCEKSFKFFRCSSGVVIKNNDDASAEQELLVLPKSWKEDKEKVSYTVRNFN